MGTWKWHGSALDSTGGNMNCCYDGTTWFTAVDIGGVARLNPATGELPQWQQGRGRLGTNLNAQSGKCASMTSDGVTAWSLGGVMPGGGAIQSRDIAGGGIWQNETTDYAGDVSGAIADGLRPTGHRRILNDTDKGAVYVCAQRTSDSRGGIARKVGAGAFADFDPANGHTIGRMWRSLVKSAVGRSDVIYGCANHDTGDGTAVGNKPCVAVYTNASTGSPGFKRLDNIGTGNPGGLLDPNDMICINEGGSDVLYVIVGEADTSNGGVWRCKITGDPTSPGWQTTPTLVWTELNGATLAAAHQYRVITGQRVGSATYLMVGNNPAGGGTAPALSGTFPIAGGKFVGAVYRTLDGHTATPTWEAVCDAANVAPGGAYLPVFGTVDETWVQLTGAQSNSSNKCAIGGSSWGPYDVDIDPANQHVVFAGKSGSWISQNPWAAPASNVRWRSFSNSTGGIINHQIMVHPTDNLKWTMTDTDRSGYYNLVGGLGQMHGIQANISGSSKSNWINQEGANAGRWLLGSDAGVIRVCDNWATTTDPDVAPTFTNDNVTGFSGELNAVAEWAYGGTTYRVAVGSSGHIYVKSGATWADSANLGSFYGKDCTIIANQGSMDFWVLEGKTGLWYFPDVRAVTTGSTVSVLPVTVTASDGDFCGSVAQDPVARTTLYCTFGNGLTGVWKLVGADNLTANASGTKTGGSGTISRMTGGDMKVGTKAGPISCDPANGHMVVAVPGYSGVPDMIHYDGTTWASIADDTYREVGMLPLSVALRGDRIYVGQFNAGVAFATFGDDPPGGGSLSVSWAQTAGPAVTLSSTTAVSPTFTAPASMAGSVLTFSLVVTDAGGTSAPDTVQVTVQPAKRAVRSGGAWQPRQVKKRQGGAWT